MTEINVTVNHPDDTDGVDAPIYEGPAHLAHTQIAPGGYDTTNPAVALLVSETRTIVVPVINIDHIHTVRS